MKYDKRTYLDTRRLKELVAMNGKPMIDQAAEMGFDRKTLNSYVYGKTPPLVRNLVAMADFYGVTVDYLLGRGPEMPCMVDSMVNGVSNG